MPPRASVAQVGGFRPPEEPATSWMGTVKLCRPGEDWPAWDGAPMHGVLQLVTRELPVRPPALEDVALLALFVAEELPFDTPNGDRWCLRTYGSLDGLEPLPRPEWPRDPHLPKDHDPALKPFPLAFSEVDDSPPREGLKVGGAPYPLQDEVEWDEPGVEHVLQVDSDFKVGFAIADSGIFYVGHRAASGTWHATIQSY